MAFQKEFCIIEYLEYESIAAYRTPLRTGIQYPAHESLGMSLITEVTVADRYLHATYKLQQVTSTARCRKV
jgi:hypothetical protein